MHFLGFKERPEILEKNSKRLKNNLANVESDLKSNYTYDELEDNLDDDFFATHFAEGLWEDLTILEKKCK